MNKTATEEFSKIPEENLSPETEVKKSKKNKLIQATNYLKDRYDFRYNLFAAKPEFRSKSETEFKFIDERNYNNLYIKLKLTAGIDIPDGDFRSLIGCSEVSPDFDPINEFIFSLPKWDGVDRFESFLSQVKLTDENIRPLLIRYFTKWFVALVGSLVDVNTINETCFVFAGKQGRGKTRFFNSLMPQDLRLNYAFTGNFNAKDKDHFEMLGTKIMINLDEMATFNRNDIETLKTTMSTRYVVLRRAFGRAPIHLYRRASFCGSNNDDKFLTDQTGNRRWLVFSIQEVNVNEAFNINLLYAQALALFKEGFNIFFDKNEIDELDFYNEQFRHIPMEEEMILTHFRIPSEMEVLMGSGIKYYTTTDVVNKLASSDEYKKINANDTMLKRMGKTLTKLGFKRKCHYIPGRSPLYVWIMKELSTGESERIRTSGQYVVEEELPI